MTEQRHPLEHRSAGTAGSLRESAFEASTSGFSLMDLEFVILDVDAAFARSTGMQPGAFLERYWSPVDIPVFDDGAVVAVLQQVEDVTDYRNDLVRVFDYLQEPPSGDSAESSRRFAEYAATAMGHSSLYHSARREVEQLQEALTSRGVIDQAKGILGALPLRRRRGLPAPQADVQRHETSPGHSSTRWQRRVRLRWGDRPAEA